jgi:hypothetical protein
VGSKAERQVSAEEGCSPDESHCSEANEPSSKKEVICACKGTLGGSEEGWGEGVVKLYQLELVGGCAKSKAFKTQRKRQPVALTITPSVSESATVQEKCEQSS